MTYWYYQGLKALLQALKTTAACSLLGDAVDGTPDVTNLVAAFGTPEVGMQVYSLGLFPPGTTILAVDTGAGTMTLSANATATTTFSGVPAVAPAIPGPLSAHLCEGEIPQQPQVDFSAITEPAYTGYAAQPLVFGSVPSDQADNAWASFGCLKWEPTDYVASALLTGWCVTMPGSPQPILLASEVFEGEVSLASPGDILDMIPILALPFGPNGPPSPIL